MDLGFENTFSSFGDALIYLMKKDGINVTKGKGGAAELAKRMYECNILMYTNDDYVSRNKEKDNARNRIYEHMDTESATNVSGKWIKRYCDYFHCSSDFLMGYIPLPTHLESDMQSKTGLSSDAIDKLISLYNIANSNENVFRSHDALEYLDIISNLLISEDFLAILKEISNADGYEIAVQEANAGSLEEIRKNISNINHWVGMLARCKYEILIRFSKMIDTRYGAGKIFKHYENDFQITNRDRDVSPL